MQSTDYSATNKASFDFDSKEHKAYDKTPAAKAINSPAGIWIASDNQQLAGWQEGREFEGGNSFDVSTKKYDEEGNEIKIPGVFFRQPRLLIIGRSPLLKGTKRKVEGLFAKGDRNLGYSAGRRYMIIFLDTQNQPLHIAPVQLTAWGSFQVNFDQQLLKFRKALEEAYAKSRKQPAEAKSELWHSMGVFCPQLKSELRGQTPDAQSPACITVGFVVPTAENWLELCVGRSEIAQDIAILHNSIKDWWKKGLVQDKPVDIDPGIEEEDYGWEGKDYSPRPASPRCDRTSLMMESERMVQYLGWSQRDGMEFLVKNYGKKSRSQLTDAEFLDFVGKLQSMSLSDQQDPLTGFDSDEIPY